MATLTYVIFEHHKKQDNTFNVKFRLTHKGKQVYYSSLYFVSPAQVKKNFTLKDQKILDAINAELAQLRRKIEALGSQVENLTAKEILQHITKVEDNSVRINFLDFYKKRLDYLVSTDRLGSFRRLRQAYHHLCDYIDVPFLDVNDISANFLREFEAYLRKKRSGTRSGKANIIVSHQFEPMNSNAIRSVMISISTIFNLCKNTYNTEQVTIINSRPFEFYKLPNASVGRKKGNDFSIDDLVSFRDAELLGRKMLARDLFMLSFYLCGMNAKDIYAQNWEIKDGRLNYERSKTKEIRKDNAFISIRIPDVAIPLLEQYTGAYLQRRYSSHDSFINALSIGLPAGLTFYHARHTFATLAYNKCGFSKDAIAMALNHVDNRMTERYIAVDWSIIDRVQDGVLSLLPGKDVIEI